MLAESTHFFDMAAHLPLPPGPSMWRPSPVLDNPKEQLPPPVVSVPSRESGNASRNSRTSVQRCGQGTLAVNRSGRLEFHALRCDSWSCPECRPVKAAQLQRRLRGALAGRRNAKFSFCTLSVNPARFEGRQIGWRGRDDGTRIRVYARPTPSQFNAVIHAMSHEWHAFKRRMDNRTRRAHQPTVEYFRVVELNRDGWPHYHVILVHPSWEAAGLERHVQEWGLGFVKVEPAGPDGAVRRLAPYLLSHEAKAAGAKAYQFAALALPKGSRLWSASRGLLPAKKVADLHQFGGNAESVAAVVLRGHVSSYQHKARERGAHTAWVAPVPGPADRPHRPPGTVLVKGDAGQLLFRQLAAHRRLLDQPSRRRHTQRRGNARLITPIRHNVDTSPLAETVLHASERAYLRVNQELGGLPTSLVGSGQALAYGAPDAGGPPLAESDAIDTGGGGPTPSRKPDTHIWTEFPRRAPGCAS